MLHSYAFPSNARGAQMTKVFSRSRIIGSVIVLILLIGTLLRTLFFFPNAAYRNFMERAPKWSYSRSFCAGIIAAHRDWIDKQSVINTVGEMPLVQDRETGLAVLTFGCVGTPSNLGFCNGYNRVITAYANWWSPPRNSRKNWEAILLDPDAYFNERLRSNKAQPLVTNGGPVLGREHGTPVWLKEVRNKDNKLIGHQLACKDRSLACGVYTCLTWPLIPIDGTLEMFAGPEGSDFLVVRGFDEAQKRQATLVFDLRYGSRIALGRES
jgi:hypothetical protein